MKEVAIAKRLQISSFLRYSHARLSDRGVRLMSEAVDLQSTRQASPPEHGIFNPNDTGSASRFMQVVTDIKQRRDARNDPGVLVPDHGGSDNGPDSAGATASPGPNTHRAGCVVVGAAAGAVIGGLVGAGAEAATGAVAGTFVGGPAGTVIGGGAGGMDGAKNGGAAGAVIGGILGGQICGRQPQPLVPHHAMSTSNENGTSPRGRLEGSTEGLTNEEKGFVEEHLAAGNNVKVIEAGSNRTPDFSVNGGPPFELKTVSGIKNTTTDGISGAISNRIMNARGQSGNVVVDARGQANMTQEATQRAINRARGADDKASPDGQGKISNITVLTSQGQFRWSRN